MGETVKKIFVDFSLVDKLELNNTNINRLLTLCQLGSKVEVNFYWKEGLVIPSRATKLIGVFKFEEERKGRVSKPESENLASYWLGYVTYMP